MNRDDIIQSLRAEIAHLQRILELMEELPGSAPERRGPGRPKGAAGKTFDTKPEPAVPQKRVMSAEGKARIAAAQKKRWAKANRAAMPNVSSGKPSIPKKRTGAKTEKRSASTNRSKNVVVRSNAGRSGAKSTSRNAVKRSAKLAPDQPSATE